MSCILSPGSPQPQYKWMKDGIPLTDFSNTEIYRITNTIRDDAGSYQCVASNSAGTIFSEKSEVVVAYMGEFKDLRDKIVSVKSGSPVILDLAEIESVPAPAVAWETKRGPITTNIRYAENSRKNQLIILSVDEDDNGVAFKARAVNAQIGKVEYSSFTELNVTGNSNSEIGPEIIVPPDDQKVVEGKETELQCIANARPLHEIETLWFKDEIPIDSADITYNLDMFNRTLTLLSVNSKFTGVYSCKVQMRTGGYDVQTAKALMTVIEPPQFRSPTQIDVFVEYATALEIPCEVYGKPSPYVTWFRNAEALDLSSYAYKKKDDNTLIIKKVGLNDSAVFQCLASNEAGEKSSYAWVKVKSKFIISILFFLTFSYKAKLKR